MRRQAKKQTKARVCPKCAYVTEKPERCCPRCSTEMAIDRAENVADKTGADSFPASDPPPH